MITVEFRFTEYSLLTYVCFVFFAAPAGLAIYLSAKCYAELSLKVATPIIAAMMLLDLAAIIISGTSSRRHVAVIPHCITLPLLFTTVVYWLSAMLNTSTDNRFVSNNLPHYRKCETVFVTLTILVLMLSSSVIALPIMMVDAEFTHSHQAHNSSRETAGSSKSELVLDTEYDGLRAMNSMATLRSQPPMMEHPSQSVTQFLWKNPPPSLHIDRNGTRVHSPYRALNGLITKRNQGSQNNLSQQAMPSLVGLEAIPEGLMGLDWEGFGAGTDENIQWVIERSNNRSLSDSTERSNSLFSVADYNRRINDAGFVREESVAPHSRSSKLTLSHYDQERLRQAAL